MFVNIIIFNSANIIYYFNKPNIILILNMTHTDSYDSYSQTLKVMINHLVDQHLQRGIIDSSHFKVSESVNICIIM